jgi:hypothetical protein
LASAINFILGIKITRIAGKNIKKKVSRVEFSNKAKKYSIAAKVINHKPNLCF